MQLFFLFQSNFTQKKIFFRNITKMCYVHQLWKKPFHLRIVIPWRRLYHMVDFFLSLFFFLTTWICVKQNFLQWTASDDILLWTECVVMYVLHLDNLVNVSLLYIDFLRHLFYSSFGMVLLFQRRLVSKLLIMTNLLKSFTSSI